jgi:hypothetical protein
LVNEIKRDRARLVIHQTIKPVGIADLIWCAWIADARYFSIASKSA